MKDYKLLFIIGLIIAVLGLFEEDSIVKSILALTSAIFIVGGYIVKQLEG